MKILSYNINKFTQEKLDKVLQHDADVFILPEVACVSNVQLPNGYGMVWTGDIDFKGLGIIWKTGIDADIPEWFNSNHQYFQPLMIEDKLIIGAIRGSLIFYFERGRDSGVKATSVFSSG